jgi:hypothetical protein
MFLIEKIMKILKIKIKKMLLQLLLKMILKIKMKILILKVLLKRMKEIEK